MRRIRIQQDAPVVRQPILGRKNHQTCFELSKFAYNPVMEPNENTELESESHRDERRQVSSDWKHLLVGQLPLQTETTTFILLNCFDIFLTYILLASNERASEANPIADYFIQKWGFSGAIGFKLAIVAFVTVIAQIIALKKLQTARFLLIGGTFLVGCVVIYSIGLLIKHF